MTSSRLAVPAARRAAEALCNCNILRLAWLARTKRGSHPSERPPRASRHPSNGNLSSPTWSVRDFGLGNTSAQAVAHPCLRAAQAVHHVSSFRPLSRVAQASASTGSAPRGFTSSTLPTVRPRYRFGNRCRCWSGRRHYSSPDWTRRSPSHAPYQNSARNMNSIRRGAPVPTAPGLMMPVINPKPELTAGGLPASVPILPEERSKTG